VGFLTSFFYWKLIPIKESKLKISKEQVEYVAHLARLDFSEKEKDKFTSQLNDILLYMEKLNEIDTTGVEPETHAISLMNAFREDVVKPSLDSQTSLANAPEEKAGCFRVPKVIE
jgi:aspartyl-tRNA(Asn)/glutamyl-tRNA(Gln) amidotransferase subunit C